MVEDVESNEARFYKLLAVEASAAAIEEVSVFVLL